MIILFPETINQIIYNSKIYLILKTHLNPKNKKNYIFVQIAGLIVKKKKKKKN